MAYDKIVDSAKLDVDLTAVANAIRTKTGKKDSLTLDAMPGEIESIETVKEPYILETYDESGHLIAAKMVGQPKVRKNLFSVCNYLTTVEISTNAQSIESGAFTTIMMMPEISIPSSVKSIAEQAFIQCVNLKTVTFHGNLDEIASNTFVQCGITTINVPWAENEVANAPWGAANATINYNYTEEG